MLTEKRSLDMSVLFVKEENHTSDDDDDDGDSNDDNHRRRRHSYRQCWVSDEEQLMM